MDGVCMGARRRGGGRKEISSGLLRWYTIKTTHPRLFGVRHHLLIFSRLVWVSLHPLVLRMLPRKLKLVSPQDPR